MARLIAKDHEAKRRHILTASARVFAEEGVARASMAQVAAACGVSKANIYHYYESKDALLFDILNSYLSTLRDRICTPQLQEEENPQKAFKQLLAVILRAYRGMDNEHKIQIEGIARLDPAQQKILKSYQRQMVDTLSGLLLRVAPDIFESEQAKLRDATMAVFGMLNWFYTWNARADDMQRDQYAARVAALTLGGVAAL